MSPFLWGIFMFNTTMTFDKGVNATEPVVFLVRSGTIRVVLLVQGQEYPLPDMTTSSKVDVKDMPFRVEVIGSANWSLKAAR